MSKLIAAVIGNSAYAREVHIPFLRACQDISLEALAYSNQLDIVKRIPSLTEGFPQVFESYHEMLLSVKPDLVVISSAPMPHYEQIKTALLMGAHVLVDKSMVCSREQAEEVVNLADRQGLFLAVAVQRRYEASVLYVRNLVQSGHLGDIRLIRVFFARSFDHISDNWRNDPTVSWGGVTADSGYHLIDTMLWITGLTSIRVKAEMSHEGMQVEQIASINVRFSNGAIGDITLTYNAPKQVRREEIILYGTGGAVFFQRNQDPNQKLKLRVTHISNDGTVLETPLFANTPDKQAPIRNFVNAILRQEQLIASGKDSIKTVTLIEDAYRACDI